MVSILISNNFLTFFMCEKKKSPQHSQLLKLFLWFFPSKSNLNIQTNEMFSFFPNL
jgi:hypothetical protein